MKNALRINGVLRERNSKSLLTGSHDEIEIQCFECGCWKFIKKITNEHITQKFLCRSCKMKKTWANKKKGKKKVAKKKVVKKKKGPKKHINQWPEHCAYRVFFKCKGSPNQCQGCYYNPDKKIALMPKYGHEADEKKTAKQNWLYGDKKHAQQMLEMLEDIKKGRGQYKNPHAKSKAPTRKKKKEK